LQKCSGYESGFQLFTKTGKAPSLKGDSEVDCGSAKTAITKMFTVSASGKIHPPTIMVSK
jgi:hypothetical protein